VERVPEAGSSVEVAVTLGEAAGADVASGPPDMPLVLAPAAASRCRPGRGAACCRRR
jgi:hypothetical protein